MRQQHIHIPPLFFESNRVFAMKLVNESESSPEGGAADNQTRGPKHKVAQQACDTVVTGYAKLGTTLVRNVCMGNGEVSKH